MNIPDNFDWKFYCTYYTDLKLAGIDTEKKAIDHYNNFGRRENRIINNNMIKSQIPEDIPVIANMNAVIANMNECFDIEDDRSFYGVSKHFCNYLINKTTLNKNHKILEVGCGNGELASQLAKYIESGLYYGLDRERNNIDYCKDKIATVFPNCRFNQIVLQNDTYSSDGMKVQRVSFPYGNEEFDVIFSTSVFLHLSIDESRHYLSEINRVLKKGGKCLIVHFLWNPFIENFIKEKRTLIKNVVNSGETKVITNNINETANCFPESIVSQWYEATRLPISEITYGHWSGSSTEPIYQDIILSTKKSSRK